MATPIPTILQQIAAAGKAFEGEQVGSREALIELGRDLVAALEIPSEFLQRSFWAEVSVGCLNHFLGTFAHPAAAGTVCSLQVCRSGQALPASAECWK